MSATPAERQLAILHELASFPITEAKTVDGACRSIAASLRRHREDLPVVLLYLVGAGSAVAGLVATLGLDGADVGVDVEPTLTSLYTYDETWGIARVLMSCRGEIISIPPGPIPGYPAATPDGFIPSPWPGHVSRALVLPIHAQGTTCGIMVCGIRPEQTDERTYRWFLELLSSHVGTVLGRVTARVTDSPRDETSHATLFSYFMQMPVPICVLRGPELTFEIANRHFYQMTARENIVGRTFAQAFPELHDQGMSGHSFAALFRRVLDTGELFEHHEFPVTIWRNGRAERAFFNAVFAPIVSPNGRIERVMAVGTEITNEVMARVKAEQAQKEVERVSEELRATEALRDDFLTLASHELRTPLTTLGLQIDGLLLALHQASPNDAPVKKLLQKTNKLRTQADRLEALIESMLDVFSLESENLVMQRSELDLAEAARSVVSRLALEHRSIHIELRSEPSIGWWDRTLVEQIIAALLSNALKFGSGRPVEVHVGGSATHGTIWVKDRGIGIAAMDKQRIFGRFVRAVPSNEYGGFGLGLWIVQEIVKAMSGNVQVESHLGKGSTFVVELPRSS